MIDNFNFIKKLLKFRSDDDFYHLQIIKRKKENPEIESNSYVVKTYYIKSSNSLDYHKDEIITLCNHHNARACINLNRRSFEKMAFHTLKKISDQIMNKDYKSVRKAYNSCCGMYSNETEKKWIIDIDTKDGEFICEVEEMLLNKLDLYCLEVETKNGYHLITKPFNTQIFKRYYPDIDIHKNNPTILYIP